MRAYRHFRFAGLLSVTLAAFQSHAAPAPSYSGTMNRATASLVQYKISKWGFAANDPRVAATFTGVGSGLTTLAIGVAGGGVAAVGWPALLVGAGISTVVGGLISLGQDSLYQWLFNADGTVTTKGAQGVPKLIAPLPDGSTYAGLPLANGAVAYCFTGTCAGDPITAVWAYFGTNTVGGNLDNFNAKYSYGRLTVYATYVELPIRMSQRYNDGSYGTPFSIGNAGPQVIQNWTGPDCAARSYYSSNTGSCAVLDIPTEEAPGQDLTHATSAAAVDNVPVGELAKPASNQVLAAAVNAAWKAASPSQGGLPWSASDPVTPQDVQEWKVANPGLVPSVSDVIAAATPTGSAAVPISPALDPATGGQTVPGTGPVTTPGTGTQVDLGPNPNTPAPTLEATPTAQQILSPVFNLMPDLKSFAVPPHAAVCPSPSFEALGKTYKIESHCALVESNRALIEAVMMLVWSIGSVFIVLRA